MLCVYVAVVCVAGAGVGGRVGRRLDVSLHVEGEVIAAREAAVAVPALERLRPGVLAVVARQLV